MTKATLIIVALFVSMYACAALESLTAGLQVIGAR